MSDVDNDDASDDRDGDGADPEIELVDLDPPIDIRGPWEFAVEPDGSLTVWYCVGEPVNLMGTIIVTRSHFTIPAADFEEFGLDDDFDAARVVRRILPGRPSNKEDR